MSVDLRTALETIVRMCVYYNCNNINNKPANQLCRNVWEAISQPHVICHSWPHRAAVVPIGNPGIMGSSDNWIVFVVAWLISVVFVLALSIPILALLISVRGVVVRFRINYTPKGVGLGEQGDEQTLSQDMRVGPFVNSVRISSIVTAVAALNRPYLMPSPPSHVLIIMVGMGNVCACKEDRRNTRIRQGPQYVAVASYVILSDPLRNGLCIV